MKRNLTIISIVLVVVVLAGGFWLFRKKTVEIQNVSGNSQIVEQNEEQLPEENVSENNSEAISPEEAVSAEAKDSGNTSAETSKETSSDETSKETKAKALAIADRLVSWGFEKANNRAIDTIIIHSSYNAVGSDPHDLDDIIEKEYKPYGVSPHYIISRSGKIYRLVKDANIAYHAGESQVPDGRTGVNKFSLGIEIVETQSESPTADQYGALNSLLMYLKSQYRIKYVLGHNEIAPGRKSDPWNFSWKKIGR